MRCTGAGDPRRAWSHPGTAQEPRRRPTEGPTEAQDSPKRPQEASTGAPRTSKNFKKCCTVSDFHGFRDFARGPPTEAQKAPKGASREEEPPRRLQEAPKTTQDRPRRAPKGSKPPRCLQGALRQLILASSWSPRGLIASFLAPFSSLARGPLDRRKHWSKSLVKRSFATAAGQMCRGHCPLNY